MTSVEQLRSSAFIFCHHFPVMFTPRQSDSQGRVNVSLMRLSSSCCRFHSVRLSSLAAAASRRQDRRRAGAGGRGDREFELAYGKAELARRTEAASSWSGHSLQVIDRRLAMRRLVQLGEAASQADVDQAFSRLEKQLADAEHQAGRALRADRHDAGGSAAELAVDALVAAVSGPAAHRRQPPALFRAASPRFRRHATARVPHPASSAAKEKG